MFRASIRSLATLIAAVGVATCADTPGAAVKPVVGGRGTARIGFEPVFSLAARAAANQLADFGITFDHVRIVIVRPAADTVRDTTIVFTPSQPDVTLDFTVNVQTDGEVFQATIDYTNSSGVVFHGQGSVQAHAADQTAPPQQIPIQYTGPGATVARVVVSPKVSAVVPPATVNFTATGFDSNNVAVPGTPFSWTTSDPTIATISNSGTLTTTGKRGTVTVTAVTPTNVSDVASVTVNLAPSGITLVSGGGQTGKAGATLPQPGVVKVSASDGSGLAGVTVNFSAPTGGKVGSSSVTTDASGLASTALTLGGVVGPQSFAATSLGLSVAIPETATGGDATNVVVVSGSGQSDTVKHALKQPLVAKVTDQFGNGVGKVTVTWVRTAGSGTLSAATSVTGADGTTSVTYTLGGAIGSETITAAVSGGNVPATFTETALPGGPSMISVVSGNTQTARVRQALAPFVVKVTDEGGNPVSGAAVAWTSSNGTLAAATTTTDSLGQSSNTMTLGTILGSAFATATVANKAATFTATVQTGVVARMVFQTGPPPTAVSGRPLVPAVQVALLDAGGNLTTATNPVTIALSATSTGAALTGTLTRNAVAGIATFDDLKVDKAGTDYTLIASSTGFTNATSSAFGIVAGGAGRLIVLAGDGQTGTVGTAAGILASVRLVDSSGNAIANAPVTFAAASGSGVVSPTAALATNEGGVATLSSWTFGTVAGPQSLVVSSPGVANVTIHATVLAGPPAHLVIDLPPPSVAQSGIAFTMQPVIELQDANQNPSVQSGVTVTAAVSSGGGTLGGTLTAVTDGSGRATFTNLKLNGLIGIRSLVFTSPGLTSATSSLISLGAGAPAKLAFSTNPTNAVVGVPFSPTIVVAVFDADGNAATTAASLVALSITSGTGPPAAALLGTLTVPAVAGLATFSGVSVNTPSAGYTLTATSTGLTPAVSSAFSALAGPPPTLVSMTPTAMDAVFSTVPASITGTNFVADATAVSVVQGNITTTNTAVQNATTLLTNFNLIGGASTSQENITVTTPFGTSNQIPFVLYSVGTAPVQLGPVNGDSGGSSYSLDCADGSVATGLNVRGGANVDNLQVVCQTVTGANRLFGEPVFTAAVGGAGGSPATLSCPANYVLIGLAGRVGSGGGGLNDMIAGVCGPIGGGASVNTASVGSNFSGSIDYTATCPAGLALAGIQGGAGDLLDRTQIKCR